MSGSGSRRSRPLNFFLIADHLGAACSTYVSLSISSGSGDCQTCPISRVVFCLSLGSGASALRCPVGRVMEVKQVCVIGAGTMGSGIAAHLANLGFSVTLLDRTAAETRAAFDRARSLRPPHFCLPSTADAIRLGSIEDDLALVGQADWVCEAIVEKLDAKKALFAQIEPHLRRDAFITTNTSGLQISLLAEDQSDDFQRRFLGTHFFNPPRYLKLLELIPTPKTDPVVVGEITRFLEEYAGRRVVLAKDTPGFIANRYGMWSMFKAVHVAERLGLTVEQVDEITGPFLGRPKSGSFRLNDLVGLDIMRDIADNLIARCPDDPHTDVLQSPDSLEVLRQKGWIGAKTGQGYYRKENREFLSLDLRTHAYRQRIEPEFRSIAELGRKPLHERLPEALELRDEVGEYLREYLLPTLQYADYLKEEISHTVQDFDRVMQWGFGWEAGPFEMIDMIGPEKIGIEGGKFYQGAEMRAYAGGMMPVRNEPEFAKIQDFPIVEQHETINIRDLGDGVTALCLKTKMGVITTQAVEEMTAFLESGHAGRLVFTSEAKCFSAGFDLKFFLEAAELRQPQFIDEAIQKFQNLGLLFSKIPSVAAVFGYTFGGGLEMAMSCSMIAAHPEAMIGLPESRVGLIPGGGGNMLMRTRNQENGKAIAEAVKLLTVGTTSTCADQARKMGYLTPTDVTVYHPDRLITEAKKLALTVEAPGEREWKPVVGPVLGMADKAIDDLQKSGDLSNFDIQIGDKIKMIFAKATSVEDALRMERAAFVELAEEGLSMARMKHMLETGKPLHN